ncbi:MAG TPA: 23S rRNA (uracil(1939)-C(5))-methyltransferase RlmD [Kofleriaceae bacterium]|nr:23S rRNA (uracil(1939)-C(5))-methyltransferase RlmD [Kofleriaceae bacterium]
MNKCQVTAASLDETGHGVGLAEGIRVHVADLLPGERAEVAIDHASPHKPEAWGRIVRRLGPTSDQRIPPACPGFGRCGGCLWQHLSYPSQLEAKRARVVAALGPDAKVGDVRPSPQLFGYRNKGKYVVGKSGDHVLLGAYAPRSHHVIDTLGCRVVAPIIDEVATWVRGAAERAQLVPYDEATRVGELRYVVIREAAGDVMIALIVAPNTPRAKLEHVANALAKHPAVRSLVAITNDRRDGAIVPSGSSAQVLFGHGHLVEELAGVKLEVGASEFLQVNRAQAQAMYTRVAELAGDVRGKRAIDLFAGLGGFGLHLARAGAEVIAVEIDRDAISQLRRAAERAGLPLTTIAGDASADLAPQLGRPDVVVVNPPRKGLSESTRELLATIAPATIIYISCGPESLGRDLDALRVQGYAPDAIEPFDLMPGTAQVETIVRLRRS